MHTNISYAKRENPQRDATLDLVKWFGFRKTRLLMKAAKTTPFEQWAFYVSFGGVNGFPVWNAFERWTGTVLPFED